MNQDDVQALIDFYDVNEDGRWSNKEFEMMVLPCERGDLSHQVMMKPYKKRLRSAAKLPEI